MIAVLHMLVMLVADVFKSRMRLEAENLFLRHQLNIATRRAPPRLRLRGSDKELLVWLVRHWPSLLDAVRARNTLGQKITLLVDSVLSSGPLRYGDLNFCHRLGSASVAGFCPALSDRPSRVHRL